jgi:electron-transferring-flavoprotein dehydrogenase
MGEQAEELGVDIFAGFSADELLWNDRKQVTGIVTADMGIGKDGQRKGNFQAGMKIKAKQVVLAEGCRGSLSERVISEFNLRKNCDPQSYGIGLKEVWQVPEENMVPGLVEHTVGWPLESNVYAGSFMYHMGPNLIHLGLVVGLDYKNPYLNPYEEFQKWKTHESVKKYLKNGTCLKYGARALNEGGFFSIPRLTFPGGVMVGCSAGFLDISKIKGSHNAIKSGTVAAESLYEKMALAEDFPGEGAEVLSYEDNLKKTDVWSSLHSTRNFKGGFKAGLWVGLAQGAVVSFITKGREGWNLRNSGTDSAKTEPASKFTVRTF